MKKARINSTPKTAAYELKSIVDDFIALKKNSNGITIVANVKTKVPNNPVQAKDSKNILWA